VSRRSAPRRRAEPAGAAAGVQLEHVDLVLGARPVLRDVSLDLAPGTKWLVLGGNGAGKTQLMKILAGERWPTPTGREHRAYRDSRDAPLDLVDLLPRIAFVGGERQDKYLRYDWNFTVQTIVGTGCHGVERPLQPLKAAERARVRVLLRRFGLWSLRRRRFLTLSYGERRLTMLARALAGRPALLLLDEPYNGLDRAARATLDRELARLARARLTVVASAHRPEDAPRGFESAFVVDEGRIAYAGPRVRAPREWLAAQAGTASARWGRAPAPRSARTRLARKPAPGRATSRPATSARVAPLLRLAGIDLYRDYRPVLRDVNWTVRAGEHWAILGANGSGKSTLLRFLYGGLPAALGGTFERRGHPPGTHLEEWRRRVAFVSPELQGEYRDRVTVEDLVVSGLRSSVGLDEPTTAAERRLARAALRRAGIADWGSREFHSLSYGQRRLALFARGLVLEPELLLLDEPLTGLDVRWRTRVQDLLLTSIRAGTQLVMAVHHEDDLLTEVRHVLLLRSGRATASER
jgi:molybdate transport system ATP-binding protein